MREMLVNVLLGWMKESHTDKREKNKKKEWVREREWDRTTDHMQKKTVQKPKSNCT